MSECKKLTPKENKFVNEICSGVNPSQAYINAYNPQRASKNTIKSQAQKILNKPYISHTIDEIRKEQQKEINYTVQDNFNELDIGAKAAMSEGNLSAYIKAIELKGKLLGFFTDKKDVEVKSAGIVLHFDVEDENA